MILRELVIWALEFLGVNGIAIGAVATVSVGLYYLNEVSGVFVTLARYARVVSILGFGLLIALLAATVLGVDLSSPSTALTQLMEVIQ